MRRSSLSRRALSLIPPHGRHGKIYLWRPLAFIGVIFRGLGRSALRIIPPYGRQGKVYLWRPLVFAGFISLALGVSAGTSYAFIGHSATAKGELAVASLTPVTVVSAGSPSSTLLPGSRGDVVFSVDNPNHSPVSLTGVTLTSGATITTDTPGCTTTDSQPVVVMNVPSVDLPQSIPANTTTAIHLANAAELNVTATTNCQGATFTIPLTIAVRP
jgi:hypothetical protein